MASTTLFAPQVRAVQPAFVYNKDNESKVKVYFNSSLYNTANDVKYILYTIIDPNKASTWGTNSMIKTVAGPVGYLYEVFDITKEDSNTGEYYIEIDLANPTKFETFTRNQFYQVQLYFCDRDFISNNIITQSWLNDNKDNISVASQATLIRPISALKDDFPVFETLSDTLYDLSLIKGIIVYEDNSTIETIDTCWFEVGSQKSEIIKNQLGLDFEIPIKFSLNAGSYKGHFYYITKNGYKKEYEVDFTIESYGTSGSLSVESNSFGCISIPGSAGKKLQRKEESQAHWDTIHTYTDGNLYYDYDIQNLNEYHYRLIDGDTASATESAVKISFEDIFLSDKDIMLAVKYNPNISGYKYVTQEGITNTLGGKYPVIRKNGDTRYRQFNLSGTLYMNASEYDETGASTSVVEQNYSDFFDHLGEQPSLYIKDLNSLQGYTNKDRLERQAREIAIDFLTNKSVKLFRSPTEGNMIVYLSNVFFTPNKQLGRAVWDFSATVTEVCEYNMENIKKYNLNDGRCFQEAMKTAVVTTGNSVTVKGV